MVFRRIRNLEADWYFEGGPLSGRSEPSYFKGPELEADRRWTPSRDLHLSGGLLEEFKVIGFPDVYQTNFKD
ncbi:hypothetical protein RclHR1_18290004 [Rhizophagus clarus]|uniref:Uncharacterized protein n=1 Tax=Rhizophagus clarus TaxID=94130 RepID=A0A2Z6QM68_9GLOM|nr:hypothetical protein RclHR1_18290003 [Rhizophagus clarus]GBB91141.1 hypothetical protein RclHR1_18290004 [Rhizophagus clarus]